MLTRIKNRLGGFRLSMRMKLILSLSAIAVVLLLSSIISILEYRSMRNYVSALIADDINSFLASCDSLKATMTEKKLVPLADSVLYSYSAYMLTSLELEKVILSDFIDSRTWYFERLQPVFGRLREDIDDLSTAIYNDLEKNSATFERGFYRSIIPGTVAVAVGILLVLLLLFFILIYYVNPLRKMLDGLDNYRSYNRRYNYSFDGDDELSELNAGITELTEENRQVRRRLLDLKNRQEEP